MNDPILRIIDRLEGVQKMLANTDGDGFTLDFSWSTINQIIRDLKKLLE